MEPTSEQNKLSTNILSCNVLHIKKALHSGKGELLVLDKDGSTLQISL